MRIRADLHPLFKDRPKRTLKDVRDKLKFMHPDKLLEILGIIQSDKLESKTESNEYEEGRRGVSALVNGKMLSLSEYCAHYGIDFNLVSSAKLVTHTGTPFYNIVMHTINDIDVKGIIEQHISSISPANISPRIIAGESVDRLIFTDVHIGLDNGRYTKEEILRRRDLMAEYVIRHQKSNTLYIDDLGDFFDGYDGRTTRSGHELEQLYSSNEQVQIGLDFKGGLFEALCQKYKRVIHNAVTDDNHAGSLAEIGNNAIKLIYERRFENLEVNVLSDFLSHYKAAGCTFILSHGKDSKYMKRPFGLRPDKTTKDIILDYMSSNGIQLKNVIFQKGDLHQFLIDHTDTLIKYENFTAFSSPSNYVKHNYSGSRSGFCFQTVKDGEISFSPYYFDNQIII